MFVPREFFASLAIPEAHTTFRRGHGRDVSSGAARAMADRMSEAPPPPPGEEDQLAARPEAESGRRSSPDRRRSEWPASERAERPRRPRYLVIALSFAMAIGAGCWTEGCDRLGFYRGEADPRQAINAQIADAEDRARADALYTHFTEVADRAHARAVPMSAAMFVLGVALLTLAARGLAGRTNTRSALVQVVVAQALVVGANYFVMRDVRAAELEWQIDGTLTQQRHALPPEKLAQAAETLEAARRWGPPSWLVMRTVVSGLIVFALTRPRSRAFFEARAMRQASGQ